MSSAQPVIRAEDLTKSYGEVRAVDGVSFELAAGEIVGFLGPNGAGKSTIMRMLTGYLLPDRGQVLVAGEPLDPDNMEARRRIGYLPEHTPLYRGMRVDRYLAFVADVHGLGRDERRAAIERVVGAFDLEGYTTRRIGTLSKGYRQRVGLAQALIPDPDLLVLDEPTSGLDPEEIVRIRDLIVELARTKTILLSTHVLSEIEEVCRRAIILTAGRVVADGSLLELGEDEGEHLSVTLEGDEDALRDGLGALPGIRDLSAAGRDQKGRVRFRLSVEERYAVAAAVSRLAAENGWPLLELNHEVSTLEYVFLSQTRRARAAVEGASG